MKPAANGKKRPRSYQKHGYYKRMRAIKKRGIDAIDGRTMEGRDALKFRADAIREKGGEDEITALTKGGIEVCTGERYLWRSGWSFILGLDSPVNKRKKCFYPIVKDVILVGDSFWRHAKDLGLERVAKNVSLEQYVEEKYGSGKEETSDKESREQGDRGLK